ncbi:MAG: deoxyribodipyrimidine photo-lyase [Armatimonadetes bacterium]|nr:deoxyribodipyrimidine photo-lyase [Armatimonadota bacterium]
MRPLVWFRSDLRTHDNTALARSAEAADDGTVALYVVSPGDWKRHDVAACRVEFILRTLKVLSESLGDKNVPLLVRTAPTPGDVPRTVLDACREAGCDRVAFNREYEVDEAARDDETVRLTREAGIGVRSYDDQVCLPPDSVKTGEGKFYSVFTPYRKAWVTEWTAQGGVPVLPAPSRQKALRLRPDPVPEEVEGFRSRVPSELWPAGERAALEKLDTFARERLQDYKADRDVPSKPGTSGLSPYLAVGALSPRQCVQAAHGGYDPTDPFEGLGPGAATWVSEIVWREFYTHVLVGFPRVCKGRAFQAASEAVEWSYDEAAFRAWCEGRTGVPIVDAAMRQLLATGWMHNRLRMVTAMFLTKNLLVDWRWGETFFMEHLIDGSFASNNGGWQWSASTGTDAAPYFRIFNPVSQGRKFDPDGTFVKEWVPELRHLDGPDVHEPWAHASLFEESDYPSPIVDLGASRLRAIAAFEKAKSKA